MNCPVCNARTREIRVVGEASFKYSECRECGWDDYDCRALEATEPDSELAECEVDELDLSISGDNDELETGC